MAEQRSFGTLCEAVKRAARKEGKAAGNWCLRMGAGQGFRSYQVDFRTAEEACEWLWGATRQRLAIHKANPEYGFFAYMYQLYFMDALQLTGEQYIVGNVEG